MSWFCAGSHLSVLVVNVLFMFAAQNIISDMALAYLGEPVDRESKKSECKHAALVSCLDHSILHVGTGEVVTVEGPFALEFDTFGLCRIRQGDTSLPLDAFLNKSLHWKNDDGNIYYWIQDRLAGDSVYVHTLDSVTERVLAGSVSGQELSMSTYVHALPKGSLQAPQ
eukprot:6486827-Amphidinium_carterae.1